MKIDINKFSWSQAFSDSTGKTCIALVCGFMMIVTACIMGITVAFIHDITVATLAGAFAASGGTLLGVRRFTKDEVLKIPQVNDGNKTPDGEELP
jgi:hypothetical protein